MKAFLFLFLFPLIAFGQSENVLGGQYEPMRGKYVPPTTSKKQQEYDFNRSIATFSFAFMGGVIRDDSERARMVKWGVLVGTTVSIGWGKKRSKKAVWRDLGAGALGFTVGSLLKNQLTKIN